MAPVRTACGKFCLRESSETEPDNNPVNGECLDACVKPFRDAFDGANHRSFADHGCHFRRSAVFSWSPLVWSDFQEILEETRRPRRGRKAEEPTPRSDRFLYRLLPALIRAGAYFGLE